jgi:hypothetical protein
MMTKQLILFFCTAILVFSACSNQPSSHSKPSVTAGSDKKKSPGKIEFTKEMHNFGTLTSAETISFAFRFKNVGGSPFHLTKVEPACGCLSVQYSKDEIESQSESAIEVIFHPEGEWGNQLKTVSVGTSNGETKTLTIVAYVENKDLNIDLNNLK